MIVHRVYAANGIPFRYMQYVTAICDVNSLKCMRYLSADGLRIMVGDD
jgi:hypothetical protein